MRKRRQAFRRQNPEYFESDSEDSGSDASDSEDEFENEELESDYELPLAENLEFKLLNEEHRQVGRPSRIRGGLIQKPKKNIPDSAFENAKKLMDFIYDEKLR